MNENLGIFINYRQGESRLPIKLVQSEHIDQQL